MSTRAAPPGAATHGDSAARSRLGWALYEAARAPTFTLIFMFIFAPYFASTVVGDPVRGQEQWALANTISGAAIAMLAPLIGAVADRTGRRKRWLAAAMTFQAAACVMLWWAEPGAAGPIGLKTIFLLIITLGVAFEVCTLMHNSLLPAVAERDSVGRLSGLGMALGNVASFTTLMAMLLLVALPATKQFDLPFLPSAPILGLSAEAHEHSRAAGPFAGLWLVLFALPFFLWTRDTPPTGVRIGRACREGLDQLVATIRQARKVANVGRFLLARMIYNDAIVAMQAYSAIYAAGVFGWNAAAILIFAILITIVCFFGSLLGGWVDSRLGSRRTILSFNLALAVALVVTISSGPRQVLFLPYDPAPVWAFPYFKTLPELLFLVSFLILGVIASVVLVSSRAMLARIAPPSMMGQFFGLFSLSGFATAFVGHGLVATATATFVSQRAGFLSVILLLAIGMLIMRGVREQPPSEIAWEDEQ